MILKSLGDKKFDNQADPLVINEVVELMKKNAETPVPVGIELYQPLHTRARRVNTATTLCACITAILVLTIGVIGGVYLYRQLSRVQMHHYRTWCAVPGEIKFKEDVEIDVKFESHEEIIVPEFAGRRRVRFIHDFTFNKTGIVDVDGRRCFVMALNRSLVLPPKTLLDVVLRLRAGDFDVDTEVVRETMIVVQPPISDYRSVGFYIAHRCASLNTFMLVRSASSRQKVLIKRSVEEPEALHFTEFAGSKILELTIVGMESAQPSVQDGVLLAS